MYRFHDLTHDISLRAKTLTAAEHTRLNQSVRTVLQKRGLECGMLIDAFQAFYKFTVIRYRSDEPVAVLTHRPSPRDRSAKPSARGPLPGTSQPLGGLGARVGVSRCALTARLGAGGMGRRALLPGRLAFLLGPDRFGAGLRRFGFSLTLHLP